MQNPHPYFVHFPIALVSAGLFFDLLGSVLKKESLRQAGWWCQVLGIIAFLGAVTTGLLAEQGVPHNDVSHGIMETHKTLELVAAGIFALVFIWRSALRTRLPQVPLFLVVYLLAGTSAVGMMLYGSHVGGRLVYEFGVGTTVLPKSEETEHEHNNGHDHKEKIKTEAVPPDTSHGKREEPHTHEDDDEHTH